MTELDELQTIRGLKFCHLNARSIVNKIDLFRLHFSSSDIDVITVSESWLTPDISTSIVNMNGYNLFRADRLNNLHTGAGYKKGGGLLIFVKNDLDFTLEYESESCITNSDLEMQKLELVSEVQSNILLLNVYRPPSGNVETGLDFLARALAHETNLHKKEIVILGDFNINYRAKSSADTKKLLAWQNRLGLTQYIKNNTRSSRTSVSTIDLIFTNMDHCTTAGVINLHISDHQPVFIVKKKMRDIRKKVVFTGRTYINYSKELLSDWLTNEVKLKFRKEHDPNKCWDLMSKFLDTFLDTHCPVKSFRTRESTPPWVTHELIILAKDRDVAWGRALVSGDAEDWHIAKHLRNLTNNSVKAAKANYVKNELQTHKSDPKKFWMNIKNVLPDVKTGTINIVHDDTKTTLPECQQAEVINDFFANIGAQLGSRFPHPPVLDNVKPGNDAFEIDPITEPEVLKLIKTISMYKSSGVDNICSRVVKDFLTLALREVTMLYNDIILTGSFPDKWKVATVTPIPKTPNASHPTDLRPISLLPIPGKLLEKHITSKITEFLENKNFFTEKQFGFRKNKSTATALTTFMDDILFQLNKGDLSVVAYLDFKKAFDTINHDILINKLVNAGIGQSLSNLLRNYLSNRKQKTKLYGVTSTLKAVKIGVPQGSTIGPIMFIVFINDLPNVLQHSSALMYADDTVLYSSHLASKTVRKNIQCDLDKVQNWCKENRLTVNVSKTKIMTFMSDHNRKIYKQFRFYLNGLQIEEVEKYKYLGTILDNKLNGDYQFSKLIKDLGFKLKTFGKIRRYLTTRAALTVYKSTILPIIDYNDYFQQLWNADKKHKLQKMQNWGLRTVYTNVQPRLNENELHLEAKLDMLESRRIYHMLILMYNRSKDPNMIDDRDLPTRQFDKVKFKVINPNVKKAFKSPGYLGAQLWDKLPRDTQLSRSVHDFKCKCLAHIRNGLFVVR